MSCISESLLNDTTHLKRVASVVSGRGLFCVTDHTNRKLILNSLHLNEILTHARDVSPSECCGLIGGDKDGRTRSIYPLTNIATNTEVAYEAAPEQLFAAQRQMRQRDEMLLAIYHSHPRASEPTPSETDVRLAYYPSATYLIVGLAGDVPVVRAFEISEHGNSWRQVEYDLSG
ncbi:MAG TPA: M67 family metallopeptidase [Pyrinomonadaceae bacterium]|nr:M67 family metallopeptidase [Pyrinomonadaceae bacterium]